MWFCSLNPCKLLLNTQTTYYNNLHGNARLGSCQLDKYFETKLWYWHCHGHFWHKASITINNHPSLNWKVIFGLSLPHQITWQGDCCCGKLQKWELSLIGVIKAKNCRNESWQKSTTTTRSSWWHDMLLKITRILSFDKQKEPLRSVSKLLSCDGMPSPWQ